MRAVATLLAILLLAILFWPIMSRAGPATGAAAAYRIIPATPCHTSRTPTIEIRAPEA